MQRRINPHPQIGDIWLVDLNDSIVGHEQRGKRPAIILAIHQETYLVEVVPLTSKLEASRFPFSYRIRRSFSNGLSSDSVAMIFQLRSISFKRLSKKIGMLEALHLKAIKMMIIEYLKLKSI